MKQNCIATKDFVWDKADLKVKKNSIFSLKGEGEEEEDLQFCTVPEGFEYLKMSEEGKVKGGGKSVRFYLEKGDASSLDHAGGRVDGVEETWSDGQTS